MPVYVEIVLINLIFYIKYATIGNVMIDNSVVSTIPRLQIELSKPQSIDIITAILPFGIPNINTMIPESTGSR